MTRYNTYSAGTIIEMPDKRRGTIVFNGLTGMGIKFGEYNLTQEDIDLIRMGRGDLFHQDIPPDYKWEPDAMLREPCEGIDLPCVGEEFIVIKDMLEYSKRQALKG